VLDVVLLRIGSSVGRADRAATRAVAPTT
jgi:hypothetical protein